MTHTLPITSGRQLNRAQISLIDTINGHSIREVASFHTPGHKQRLASIAYLSPSFDVTELPGLDELAYPSGVLSQLEARAAAIWQADQSIVSVNGSSAALMAAVLSCTSRGSKLILPRNAHRSLIHALVLSGLEPVWCEAEWSDDLKFHSCVKLEAFEAALEAAGADLAGAVITSPTYSGALLDVEKFAALAHAKDIPLIVDEAQGAHLPSHAVAKGADITVHSLHKTLGALTQTGLLHVGTASLIEAGHVRSMLHLLQTSSPSYLLLASVEQALDQLQQEGLAGVYSRMKSLRRLFEEKIASLPGLHVLAPRASTDAAHILVSHDHCSAPQLHQALLEKGIFTEAVIGSAVLLLLGTGSTEDDITACSGALAQLKPGGADQGLPEPQLPIEFAEQCLTPRQAYLAAAELVDIRSSAGRIAAECFAPCPPGTALTVPGQRIGSDLVRFGFGEKTRIRVVVES